MIAREIHFAQPGATAAINSVVRLTGTLLCLAGVAVLVVVLRFGIYEYFHGESRVLAWVWKSFTVGDHVQ